jgi:uncharacterized membrane protein
VGAVTLPPRTRLETGLELLCLLGLLGGAGLLLAVWPELPDRVPGHYDAAGRVTRYDPKGSLWLLWAVSAGLYVLLSVINRFPNAWNIGLARPAEHPEAFRRARTTVRALKAVTVWLFTFILWNSVRVAQGEAAGLPGWFVPVVFVLILGPTLFLLYEAGRNMAAQGGPPGAGPS